jgi:hypothetical protein
MNGVRAVSLSGEVYEPNGGIEGGYYREPFNFESIIPRTLAVENLEKIIKSLETLITKSEEDAKRLQVEMEALTGAAVAALTLYDMLKAIDETMTIQGVSLLEKSGGKHDFQNAFPLPPQAAVLVMSDSISAGQSRDMSGLLIVERLKQEGLQVADYRPPSLAPGGA